MKIRFTCMLFLLAGVSAYAQYQEKKDLSLNGSFQTDLLFSEEDEAIGARKYDPKVRSNTYVDLFLYSRYINAGARLELLTDPLPGYDDRGFDGQGIPYFFVSGKYKWFELTAGDFYDQFGSGFIFRTYQERSLGIDNSLRGGRLVITPEKGIRFKILGGTQRNYWKHTDSYVLGGDLELNMEEWFQRMRESGSYLQIAGSYVRKHEDNDEIRPVIIDSLYYRLNFPENVNAFDIRARFQKGNYTLLAEYAQKTNDPSSDNDYIYRKGSALLLSASYSRRGMSLLLQAKRSDNMSFRSIRSQPKESRAVFINHLPAFTMQHTYALAALYPYATQPGGEWAFQGEFRYNFRRHSVFGGRYGTDFRLHASHIRGIDKQWVDSEVIEGTDGYTSKFFKMGEETYYQDINVEISKKLLPRFKLSGTYMNQRYNQTVIQGEGGTIVSNIFILEGNVQASRKLNLRAELQYLRTKQDDGDWIFGLLELSVLPSLMFTVSDMYNNGSTDLHYYMGAVSYTYKAHRLQVAYARTRAGFNCSGGVCRWIPASKGFQVSYNFNF